MYTAKVVVKYAWLLVYRNTIANVCMLSMLSFWLFCESCDGPTHFDLCLTVCFGGVHFAHPIIRASTGAFRTITLQTEAY